MTRSLVTVSTNGRGWWTSKKDSTGQWFCDKDAAVAAGKRISLTLFEVAGNPTGVVVQMGDGDWVMVGTHG